MPEPESGTLTVLDHSRDSAGLTYVYPVVSRRAEGVSIGVNLNVNNACNWRCIYCQVPGLSRGGPPPVDFDLLRRELGGFLVQVLRGDFLSRHVPSEARRLNDIALSGNGEPTSVAAFDRVIETIGEVRRDVAVPVGVKTVLITNGSLISRPAVKSGIAKLAGMSGEIWFKIDSATATGMRRINNTRVGIGRVEANLTLAANACPTWIQTCMFMIDGAEPAVSEQTAYLEFLRARIAAGVPLKGVLLYGLARQSRQPEAARLAPLPSAWLEGYARKIRALGLVVKVTP